MELRGEIRALLSADAEQDFIGLWEVVRCVREQLPDEDADTVRQTTLDIVQDLLVGCQWEAGFPEADGRRFRPWTAPPANAIERIRREWDRLGREPNIGEIAWLNLKS